MRAADTAQDARSTGHAAPYRTEAERSIADMLNSYGIPFYYQQPTLVVNNGHRCIEYADFFLPTYAGLSVNYVADSTAAAYQRKMRVYGENQVPAVFLTRQDLSGPNWQQELYRRLEQMYHEGPAYRPYGKCRSPA